MSKLPAMVALGLGSNLGNRRANLLAAIQELCARALTDAVQSKFIETEPVDCHEQAPRFLNGVLTGRSHLSADQLLQECRRIESALGRPGERGPNEDRVIDIDLLLHGEETHHSTSLVVPHPRMTERLFVLEPLAEIAPDWVVPSVRRTVRECLECLQSDV